MSIVSVPRPSSCAIRQRRRGAKRLTILHVKRTAVGMRIAGFPNEPPITFLSREATVVIRVTGMEPG
jgi:hypothetical protein